LFRGRYDHETALIRFSDQLLQTYGREGIAARVAREVPIILQAQGAAVYMPAAEGTDYVLVAGAMGDGAVLPESLPATEPLLAAVLARHRRLVKDEITETHTAVASPEGLMRTFRQLGAMVAWPLVSQDRLLGLLLLGEKRHDNVFTSDDLELLGALASQAAVALDNARLYEQAIGMKRHYETMLRHLQRGVLTVDSSLRVVTLNDTGATILGVQASDCIGKPAGTLVPELAELLAATVTQHADQPAQEVALTSRVGLVPCECETSLMLDARGRATGAVLVFQDLTERKRFQETVRRMDRLASVGTLAAGLAHEIKNPLVSIQTFAQLLPERYGDRDFREGFGSVVRDEVSRINRLVQSLLEFARPRPFQIGPVAVHELLDRALTLLGGELHRQGIVVTRDYGDDVGIVAGDGERLFQVFFNLLQNAIQAMDTGGGQLVLSTSRGSLGRGALLCDAVRLSVRDTGKGIDAADLPHIFDPFYTTKPSGTGLGLSICHAILREHEAHIEVASEVGKGTTFTIVLPLMPAAAGPAGTGRKETPCRV